LQKTNSTNQNKMTEEQQDRAVPANTTAKISVEKIGLKAGLITCGALIMYFMIMISFDFMYSAIAWGMNFIILLTGIVLAYRYYRTKTNTTTIDYMPGLLLGGITTAVSVFLFMIFEYIFFTQADGALVLLRDNILFMGEEVTPTRAAAATMIEGISSGVIISFAMMQYFRAGIRVAFKRQALAGS